MMICRLLLVFRYVTENPFSFQLSCGDEAARTRGHRENIQTVSILFY